MLSSHSQLRDVDFHDAVIGDVVISVVDRSCWVSVKLPDTLQVRSESHCQFMFKDVGDCFARLDFRSLLEERWAGNVQNCCVNVDAGAVRLYLAGGLIESRSVLLVEQASMGSLASLEGSAAQPDSLSQLVELTFDE